MRKRRRRGWRPGAAPGSLHPPEERRVEEVALSVIQYDETEFTEKEGVTPEEAKRLCERPGVTWLDVVGLHDVEVVSRLGELFGLHPLALEDTLSTDQRPKQDDYEDHLFVVTRVFRLEKSLESDQLSLFVGRNFVVTFHEAPSDVLDPVRERLRAGRGRIRKAGSGYLAYAILDATVDRLFPILEQYGERIEQLERELFEDPDERHVPQIQQVKKDLLEIRRTAWPLREAILGLERGDSPRLGREIHPFLRDLYDHIVQVMDMVETFRDLASGLMDLYLSSMSNRMNEIMKVLTITATIFIPLTFVAGVYGMNFDPSSSPWNMPELRWRFGYPLALGVMAVVAVVMLFYFRRRKWL